MSHELANLISAYKRVFKTPEGSEVLDDLRDFCNIDVQAGSELSHADCAYRNGTQDMYRYIEAIISEDE
jgi:hypothetical protein|tara:strand:+ start:1094 stop:1300 length:207 start_codon:yes stop_codon:yes gene_type:complete